MEDDFNDLTGMFPELEDWPMTEAQIKHMVNRFLGWKLPENFHPDAGISYTRPSYGGPTGTNLFDAQQAEAMVRYMIEGIDARLEPAAEGGAEVTPEQRAIEFGEYLAKAAKRYLDATNIYAKADIANAGELDFTELAESCRNLLSAIYEFRKRAAKTTAPRDKITRGLNEAIEYAKGNTEGSRTTIYPSATSQPPAEWEPSEEEIGAAFVARFGWHPDYSDMSMKVFIAAERQIVIRELKAALPSAILAAKRQAYEECRAIADDYSPASIAAMAIANRITALIAALPGG